MVKAIDFEYERFCVHVPRHKKTFVVDRDVKNPFLVWCMFDSRHGRFFFFFYDDDGGATRSGAREREARASTCRNESSECRR